MFSVYQMVTQKYLFRINMLKKSIFFSQQLAILCFLSQDDWARQVALWIIFQDLVASKPVAY